MIHDLKRATARLYGFFKKYPNATPIMIRSWLELIEIDQMKDIRASHRAQLESFPLKDRKSLETYRNEIFERYQDEKDVSKILFRLKSDFPAVKILPSEAIVNHFLNTLEDYNG